MTRYTTSGDKSTVAALNTELSKIATSQEDFLTRTGEAPNQMEASLDMNSQRILNLPEPIDPTDAARKKDIDDLRELPSQAGQSGKYLTTNGTTTKWSFTPTTGGAGVNLDSLNHLRAKMAAGETIKIACFGDSTTDGFGTTGWVKNPVDGNDNAVGNTDQNTTGGVNAYPKILQDLLRDMYGNTNISTFNAGYSGQRMDNGWANENYQQAVIDNPFYGRPDITIIAFGLNDISTAGSQIEDYIGQSRTLISRILDDGTLPILMTSDAMFRNGDTNDTRDHKEATREIDEAQRFLAKEYGIPLFDMGAALQKWAQNNSDQMGWVQMQPDALHFEDKGHIFKAGFLATQFFTDYVYHGEEDQYISTCNSATAYSGDSNFYKFSNGQQGGNVLFNGDAPADTEVLDLWIWNESPNAHLIYLGIDDEWQGTYTTEAKITVDSKLLETTTEKTIISAGGIPTPGNLRRSDEHYIFGKLSWGWNNVKYTTGDSVDSFFGGFRLMNGALKPFSNPLPCKMFGTYTSGTGIHLQLNPADGLDTAIGGFLGDTIKVAFDFTTNREGGVMVLHGQGFDTTQAGVDKNRQNGVLLFRKDTDEIAVYSVSWSGTTLGDVTFKNVAQSTPLTWTGNNFKGRLEISKVGSQQQVQVYDAYQGGSAVINALVDTSDSVRWSGEAGGGIYFNTDTIPAGGTVELNELFYIRE